jgi:hypothetical protein
MLSVDDIESCPPSTSLHRRHLIYFRMTL